MKTELGLTSDWDEFADSPLSLSRAGSAGVQNGMSFRTDSSSPFDQCAVDPTSGTDEGRLSRALQSWMPDHVIKSLHPREKPPPEPVFTGRLGKESPVFKESKVKTTKANKSTLSDKRCKTAPRRRVPSSDSIETSLSLLTCSSGESKHADTVVVVKCSQQRSRRRKVASRASTRSSDDQPPTVSKWVELASKKSGFLSRLNRNLAIRSDYGLIGGDELSGESEAFRLFAKDEQDAVFETGRTRGIVYIHKNTLKRSDSVNNVFDAPHHPGPSLKRVLSASANKGFGKPLDIAELKRERLARLLAEEQARQQLERERRKGRRGAVRKISASSIAGSLAGLQQSPSATGPPSVSAVSQSAHSSDQRANSPSERGDTKSAEEKVTVWKGDREILEIDLKRELTQRVKKKISSTRFALKRVTGMGDSNDHTASVAKHEEFPNHVEEDFCHRPRIIQKMRISPHLSDVIHDDIQVRMGRPRYHEIRVADLEQWNKGQSLDRSHRNLKVFNWLHSLRESEFQSNYQDDIADEIPDVNEDLELLHVESADEPDVKPLYRAYEVRIL